MKSFSVLLAVGLAASAKASQLALCSVSNPGGDWKVRLADRVNRLSAWQIQSLPLAAGPARRIASADPMSSCHQ